MERAGGGEISRQLASNGANRTSERPISTTNKLTLNFRCPAELEGLIPKPIPAAQGVPDWLKAMPATAFSSINQHDEDTIKRCPPLVDAMTCGFLLPLVCDLATKGLIRKDYLNGEAGTGGVYLWESRQAAEAWFTEAKMDELAERFGVPPRLTWYDTHVTVDNLKGETRVNQSVLAAAAE